MVDDDYVDAVFLGLKLEAELLLYRGKERGSSVLIFFRGCAQVVGIGQ